MPARGERKGSDEEVAAQRLEGIKFVFGEKLERIRAICNLQEKNPGWDFGDFSNELRKTVGEQIIDLRDGTEANKVIADVLTSTINGQDEPQLLKEFASGLLQKLQENSKG